MSALERRGEELTAIIADLRGAQRFAKAAKVRVSKARLTADEKDLLMDVVSDAAEPLNDLWWLRRTGYPGN